MTTEEILKKFDEKFVSHGQFTGEDWIDFNIVKMPSIKSFIREALEDAVREVIEESEGNRTSKGMFYQ